MGSGVFVLNMGRVRSTRHIPRLKMKNGQHLWTGVNCFYSALLISEMDD